MPQATHRAGTWIPPSRVRWVDEAGTRILPLGDIGEQMKHSYIYKQLRTVVLKLCTTNSDIRGYIEYMRLFSESK